jgi:hypothetical protein
LSPPFWTEDYSSEHNGLVRFRITDAGLEPAETANETASTAVGQAYVAPAQGLCLSEAISDGFRLYDDIIKSSSGISGEVRHLVEQVKGLFSWEPSLLVRVFNSIAEQHPQARLVRLERNDFDPAISAVSIEFSSAGPTRIVKTTVEPDVDDETTVTVTVEKEVLSGPLITKSWEPDFGSA